VRLDRAALREHGGAAPESPGAGAEAS
jgi:hypothetical protein